MAEETSEDLRLATDNADGIAAKSPPKGKARNRGKESSLPIKRRCVSTACIACRRRKSKCDGNTPSCAACASVYGTECVYDPNSDHRRKGVYKKDIDNLKTRNSTLQTLIQAILNYPEDEVPALIREIRSCESLDDVAESIIAKENRIFEDDAEADSPYSALNGQFDMRTFESELSGKMGQLRLENGSVRFIGGTSNLIFLGNDDNDDMFPNTGLATGPDNEELVQQETPILSWTNVTSDVNLILHLLTMYFTWHYPYFTTLSRKLFYKDFARGKPPQEVSSRKRIYCSSLLVNAMLALGCHFTSWPEARSEPTDSATAGDHFFREAKRLILENDEHEKPRLTTVQALALMSVREAGCGREAKGWVYSGMSFRMACDLGLNLDSGGLSATKDSNLDELEVDARRITFWGCFLFDKCWSNYMGRIPQLPNSTVTVPKIDVFPEEDAEYWSPYTDAGVGQANSQPSRTRAVALQISLLCEISSDLIMFFYHPTLMEKHTGKAAELKKLSELHTRLEAWRKNLPKELEAKEATLPPVLLMHMFFHLLYIHLFRPFLKYNQTSSPLPTHVSPRRLCTQAASSISKLLRLYKRTYGLRQICNVAVYIAHSACTIHLLNLPEKSAKRDIIHGVKHLEEIAEGWLCARRTLGILSLQSKRWKIDLPEEAEMVLTRSDQRWGPFNPGDVPEMKSEISSPRGSEKSPPRPVSADYHYQQQHIPSPATSGIINQGNPQEILPPEIEFSVSPPNSQSMAVSGVSNSYSPIQSNPSSVPHHSRPGSYGGSPQSVAASGHARSPSALFGGVESLVQESQDWWLKDQSALAIGFDNWGMMEPDSSPMVGYNHVGDNFNNTNGLFQQGSVNWHGGRNGNVTNVTNGASVARGDDSYL